MYECVTRCISFASNESTIENSLDPLESLNIENELSDDSIQISIDGTTNSEGKITFIDGEWGDLLDTEGRLLGEVDLMATFNERIEPTGGQTILGSVSTASMISTASSTVSAVQSSVQLDSDDSALVRLQVSTDANDLSLIDGLPFLWALGNSTNSVSSSNGTSNVQANGFLEKNVDYPGGGEIVFQYDSQNAPFWMQMSPSSVTVDLLPFPVNNNGDTTGPVPNVTNPSVDPNLDALEINCGKTEWIISYNETEMVTNSPSNTLECSIYNSNEVTVFVEMDLDLSVQGVEIDGDLGTSFSLFSNETRSLTLTTRNSEAYRDGTLDISFEITAPDFVKNISYLSLNFSFISDENPVIQTDASAEETSSNNTVVIAGAILLGVLLTLVLGVILLRRSGDENEDDEVDEVQDKIGAMPLAVSGDANQTGFETEIPKGVPLDELMRQGKRPSPVSMEGRRKTNEEQDESEVEVEEEPEIQVEEEDYTKSEDYHVDDDGTEWWKDEVGVWWWRGPDDEEWSEYAE